MFYNTPWYRDPFTFMFILGGLVIIALLNQTVAMLSIDSCVHKGVITDFAEDNMVQLDNDKWVGVSWGDSSKPRGWDRKVYEGSSALKCVGNGFLWDIEIWRIGD